MPERFETSDVPSYAIQSAIYKYDFASQYLKNKVALDVASGIGYGSNLILNKEKSCKLIAVDNYLIGLQYGQKTYSKEINFCNADAHYLPFKNSSYDVVISFETIEHLSDLEKFFKEIHRVLKDKGILICSSPNRLWSERIGINNEFHLKEYSHSELHSIISQYFCNITSYGQVETASDILYKFPFIFKIYRIFRPLLARLFKVRDPNVVVSKNLNPKFRVKGFWPTSPYLIFKAEK